MSIVKSFPPIADASARILILGSMPGVASLQAQQYYAHPRNGFWRIMAHIYNFNAESAYERRVENLMAARIAVWDVLHTCERPGSLDSAIINGSRISNDFQLFFEHHPNIRRIAFNGAEAENSFNRFVLAKINAKDLSFTRLPSSSPANTQALAQKIVAWRNALTQE